MSNIASDPNPVTDRDVEVYNRLGAVLPGSVEDTQGLQDCFCGERVAYVRALDRFVHESGTDNRMCWLRQNTIALHVHRQ